ncbi:hypothetical protein I3842_05G110500 [Carya illinoinensis]|uniref:Ankyrin repeat protein n=1 Tax=Carya illinoinensis TaxID=32201 RepID=A0A922JPR6_CARIL|nr:hypothetical protein I3842_05G110500 [Carya illinoinensis]
MMVFVSLGTGVIVGNHVSRRLVDASYNNDLKLACECIVNPLVDVNFVGIVSLKTRKAEIVLHDESAHGVRVKYEEFKTEVTALFLVAHSRNLKLVRMLLVIIGANVNQKVFRAYVTTAAVREGHMEILEVLINAGASQQACEESLLEASYLGIARPVELLMGSDMVRPQVALHALVSACCRGFVNVVDALFKFGLDANASDRVLLQSSKPFLHTNFDCNALVATVASRQVSVIGLLLQMGIRTNIKPYPVTWCAVEYFEASGAILRMLLQHLSPNTLHHGRTLIQHAILCNNARAVDVLLHCGADVEFSVKTTSKSDFGCNTNSQTEFGDTELMTCERHKNAECLKILASTGVDFGLMALGLQQGVAEVIQVGKVVQSSNASIFSPLLFIIQDNDMEALKKIIEGTDINLDEKDANGFSANMVAAAFQLRVYVEANVKLHDKQGEMAASQFVVNQNSGIFQKLNINSVEKLTTRGYDLNALNDDGYTPLMLAAMGGHGKVCDVENERHETTLSLARKNGSGKDTAVEIVIMDELARTLVLGGTSVVKHTKRGAPHGKILRMVGNVGILRWGKSNKRNVICKGAEVGPSDAFRWHRRRKFDADEPGMFHVVTTDNKVVHFVCDGGVEMAEFWVRGIKLVTRAAIFGREESSM